MDKILNFVALRRPEETEVQAIELAESSEFQNQLEAAAGGKNPLGATTKAAQAFARSDRMITNSADVRGGEKLVALFDRLNDRREATTVREIEADVREVVGDLRPSDLAKNATRARDSVLAGYLLGDPALAQTAVKLVRIYSAINALQTSNASQARLDAMLRFPLVLPPYLEGLRDARVSDSPPAMPPLDEEALLGQFKQARERYERLSKTLDEISLYQEDELVLSEFGSKQPLATAHQQATGNTPGKASRSGRDRATKPLPTDENSGASSLRRAALRANVFLSDAATELLSKSARKTFKEMQFDPATTSIAEIVKRLKSDREGAAETQRDAAIQLSRLIS